MTYLFKILLTASIVPPPIFDTNHLKVTGTLPPFVVFMYLRSTYTEVQLSREALVDTSGCRLQV
jgi:hypothetical protein